MGPPCVVCSPSHASSGHPVLSSSTMLWIGVPWEKCVCCCTSFNFSSFVSHVLPTCCTSKTSASLKDTCQYQLLRIFPYPCLSILNLTVSLLDSFSLFCGTYLVFVSRRQDSWGSPTHPFLLLVLVCEANVPYVCAHTLTEIRGGHWVSSSVTLHCIPSRERLSLNLKLGW